MMKSFSPEDYDFIRPGEVAYDVGGLHVIKLFGRGRDYGTSEIEKIAKENRNDLLVDLVKILIWLRKELGYKSLFWVKQ